jgi:hypothetical protein
MPVKPQRREDRRERRRGFKAQKNAESAKIGGTLVSGSPAVRAPVAPSALEVQLHFVSLAIGHLPCKFRHPHRLLIVDQDS